MYECHQVQNHVSQQANLLESHLGNDPTTDSHRHAVSQLETEVTSWYTSFCNLFCYQREYLRILNQWVRLTDRLPENDAPMGSTSNIRVFGEDLQRILDRLPDKVLTLPSLFPLIVLMYCFYHFLIKLIVEGDGLGSVRTLVLCYIVQAWPS